MSEIYDFIIVGGGSAGAAIAARLTEDLTCSVALIEAGQRPPDLASVPAACVGLQLNPETDWMFTADPGRGGLGLREQRMPVPRGRMLSRLPRLLRQSPHPAIARYALLPGIYEHLRCTHVAAHLATYLVALLCQKLYGTQCYQRVS